MNAKFPSSLPIFSTDTEEEARALQILFCSYVSHGPLAGRYVNGLVNAASYMTDEKSIAALFRLQVLMADRYELMTNKE